ncbi:antirestriction protein [Paraburkholderia sp. HD33-4]|uniref:antirestriction protein n=1 Tax=Paraburkholderia sp. HD33-4 TaxID=2883242 RepID=UPI001F2526A7|nr:antirestriction protein [Paraburkholderia sp. HD33-4]
MTEQQPITATVVPTRQRLAFLPDVFTPRLMMQGEAMIYRQADQLSADYNGGLWAFYRLSNGGFFVAPDNDKRYTISVAGNGYEGEVSALAFGMTVTLFVLGSLCWIENEALRERFTDNYHQLRQYVLDQPEAGAVLAAID